jgi:hypothetical protein
VRLKGLDRPVRVIEVIPEAGLLERLTPDAADDTPEVK